MESRLKALLGNAIKGTKLYYDSSEILLSETDNKLRVILEDFRADVGTFPDPTVLIAFDLEFSFDCPPNGPTKLKVKSSNLQVLASSGVLTTLFTLFVSELIDNEVESRIEEDWSPIAVELSAGLDICPMVDVNDDGAVCLLDTSGCSDG